MFKIEALNRKGNIKKKKKRITKAASITHTQIKLLKATDKTW